MDNPSRNLFTIDHLVSNPYPSNQVRENSGEENDYIKNSSSRSQPELDNFASDEEMNDEEDQATNEDDQTDSSEGADSETIITAHKEAIPKKKKRKRKNPHMRRNIRDVYSNKKLEIETQMLREHEQFRLQRLGLSNIPPLTHISTPVVKPNIKSQIPKPLPNQPKKSKNEVICIDSDSDDDKLTTKKDTSLAASVFKKSVTSSEVLILSSDSDEDIMDEAVEDIVLDERKQADAYYSELGLHTNDNLNIADKTNGRVLVNVNHSANDEDIFLPKSLSEILKPHQIGGIRFLFDNLIESVHGFSADEGNGCILAHAMGLGKTIQTIMFMDIFLRYTPAKKVLCVVPVNTIQNWVNEFNTWLPPKPTSTECLKNPDQLQTKKTKKGANKLKCKPEVDILQIKTLLEDMVEFVDFKLKNEIKHISDSVEVLPLLSRNLQAESKECTNPCPLSNNDISLGTSQSCSSNTSLGPTITKNSLSQQLCQHNTSVLLAQQLPSSSISMDIPTAVSSQINKAVGPVQTQFPQMSPILQPDKKHFSTSSNILNNTTSSNISKVLPVRNELPLNISMDQSKDFTPSLFSSQYNLATPLLTQLVSPTVSTHIIPTLQPIQTELTAQHDMQHFFPSDVGCPIMPPLQPIQTAVGSMECSITIPFQDIPALLTDHVELPLGQQDINVLPPKAHDTIPPLIHNPLTESTNVNVNTEAYFQNALKSIGNFEAIDNIEANFIQNQDNSYFSLRKSNDNEAIGICNNNGDEPIISELLNEMLDQVVKQEDLEKKKKVEQTYREFNLFMIDAQKSPAGRIKVINEWDKTGGVLLIGYEMYRAIAMPGMSKRKRSRKDEELYILNNQELKSAICTIGPDLVVCDEGHRIRNYQSGISQALKSIRTRKRLVLTGYPLQNNLIEYWCMVDFVRPNYLGSRQAFANMFERPIMNGQCIDSTDKDKLLMRQRAHVLYSLLQGFVQRRGHDVLKTSLPPKQEYVLMVRLSPIQKELYRTLIELTREAYCDGLNPIKTFCLCCKIWNHPDILYNAVIASQQGNLVDIISDEDDISLEDSTTTKAKRRKKTTASSSTQPKAVSSNVGFDPFGTEAREILTDIAQWAGPVFQQQKYVAGLLENSGKFVILMKIIDDCFKQGDKLLVFSQSLFTLTTIEEVLKKRRLHQNTDDVWLKGRDYFRLDGSTNASEREYLIKQFNKKENQQTRLFLLSTRAGCLGINLIGANRVVVFDVSWNPCHDAQAVCRIFRYGQKKSCYIYRLVSSNTMEKKIYYRQISKQGISDRVVDEMNLTENFSKNEIQSLIMEEWKDEDELSMAEKTRFYKDPILKSILQNHSKWIAKAPFKHESLLVSAQTQRLSGIEKQAAKRAYEHEKRIFQGSHTVSSSRRSYPLQQNFPSNSPIAPVRPFLWRPPPILPWSDNESSTTRSITSLNTQTNFQHNFSRTMPLIDQNREMPLLTPASNLLLSHDTRMSPTYPQQQYTQRSDQQQYTQHSDQQQYTQHSDQQQYTQRSDQQQYTQRSDQQHYTQRSDQQQYTQRNDMPSLNSFIRNTQYSTQSNSCRYTSSTYPPYLQSSLTTNILPTYTPTLPSISSQLSNDSLSPSNDDDDDNSEDGSLSFGSDIGDKTTPRLSQSQASTTTTNNIIVLDDN